MDLHKRPHPPVPEGLQPGEYIEQLNHEIALYIGMLYFLVEVFRSDDTFGDELSQFQVPDRMRLTLSVELSPPMPVFLFSLVAGLRDKAGQGYPVKKLLLLVWKSLLACLGGTREARKVKELSRELSGLPPAVDSSEFVGFDASELTFRLHKSISD